MVGGDAAAIVQLHANSLETKARRVGTPSDGHQHHIGLDLAFLAACRRLNRHHQAVLFLLHTRDLGGKLEGHALLGQHALKGFRHFHVHAGRDAVQKFNHRDVRAQALPDRTQFQPDHAGAHHQQLLWHFAQRKRAGGRYDLLFINGDAGQWRHIRTRGDDDVFGRQAASLAAALHFDFSGRGDAAFAHNGFALGFLEQEFHALGELAHHLVLGRHHGGQVEADLCLDAHLGEVVLRFVETLRRMQQGLGRDAADIEAGAAKDAALVYAGGGKAKLAQPDGGVIAARSAADHTRVKIIRHAVTIP